MRLVLKWSKLGLAVQGQGGKGSALDSFALSVTWIKMSICKVRVNRRPQYSVLNA